MATQFKLSNDGVCSCLVVCCLLIATCRIVASYGHLSHVYDEPFHALRGVQWLTGQVYRHTEHPPLGPALCAIVPVLMGTNIDSTGHKQRDGLMVLYADCHGDECVGRLASFRVGNILFMWLAGIGLYRWVKFHSCSWTGLAAVGLWSQVPSILAHSGLLTTDAPLMALIMWTLIVCERALVKLRLREFVLAGIVTGLAFLTKYSALLFLPVCLAPVVFGHWPQTGSISRKRLMGYFAVAGLVLGLVIWSAFGFSVAPLGSISIAEYRFAGFSDAVSAWVVPAPEYVAGVIWTMQKLEAGHGSYLFDVTPPGGSPWFFPVALAVKTPIMIAFLFLYGAVVAVKDWRCGAIETWSIVPTMIAGSLLLVVLPSSINIGLRHLLPIYLFVSSTAAVGLVRLLNVVRYGSATTLSRGLVGMFLLVGLFWTALDGWAVHPHYLSYFNEPARVRAKPILIDSDLDWGQGLIELGRLSRRLEIEKLQVEHSAPIELSRYDLPPPPTQEDRHYWLAISVSAMYVHHRQLSGYQDLTPDAVIPGGAIRLFRIDRNEPPH